MTEPAAPTRTEPVLDSVTRADPSDELATTTLLRAAIGPVNTNYYLGIFTRFDAQDKTGPSWNTAAALSTLNWMLYRRMWNAALAYAGIALTVALLVFGIGKLALHYSSEVQWGLAGLYALVLVAVPGLFGNALLFKQYRSDMARSLSAHHTITEAAAMLAARAPSRQRLMVLGGLNLVAAAAVVAVVQWASGFNGLPTSLGAPSPTAPAVAASGNVATGRAVEAPAAPVASSATPAASAPQSAASAPKPAASVPQAAASTPALQATAAASAPLAAASTARTPTAVASAPVAKTSTPATPNAGRGSVQASTPPTTQAAEKAEAAKLAPLATAQNRGPAPGEAAAAHKKSAPAPKVATTAPAANTPPPAAHAKVKAAPPAQTAVPETGAGKVGVPAGSFGINVGLFADDNNARNAFVKLSDAGLSAYTQETRGKKGKLTWVRVGPFDSMAQAEKTVEKIRALGLEAQVFKQAQ